MITTLLDKIQGFFDQRFLFAYWGPTFIGLALGLGLVEILFSPILATAFKWWTTLNGSEQLILGAGALIAVTLLASLLGALTVPIIRLYEGYWPEGWLKHWALGRQQKALKAVGDSAVRYQYFPRNLELLRPTRLGNVLITSSEYSIRHYVIETAIWWPRLAALLPESFRTQVDAALTPMLTVLNLSMILTFLTVASGIASLFTDRHWWLLPPIIIIIGLLLARVCYLAGVSQAVSYSKLVQVAFDFYRHDILKQMHIPVPDNLLEERQLWAALNAVVYDYVMPWHTTVLKDLPSLNTPFYYDTHKNSADSNKEDLTIIIKDLSKLNIKNEEKK